MSIFSEDQTIAILDRHLTADYRVMPMAEMPTPRDVVLSLAKQLGVSLPLDVLSHLTGAFPGIYVEAKEDIWRRAQIYDVGPAWSFSYGLHTFTASSESEDWMRIDFVADQLLNETGKKVFPVLKVIGNADIYCVNEQSELVLFDHEVGEFILVNTSFFDLFELEIKELTKRTEMKKNMDV